MKSYVAKQEEVERTWFVVDAAGQPLGRLAVKVANVLRGRNKVTYTPHVDTGDFVVVVNAEKVKLTGRKNQQKVYKRYTGYRDGLREQTAAVVRARHPERLIERAVRGMLPRNRLSRQIFARLKVYAGAEHPHAAHKPAELKIG
ncbi:MAG: 50S ribosomal protein L13 [Kiritimatiellae bacterium]|nr:50S ribosomal protein L13 [Kiritimatiellia bacterium]